MILDILEFESPANFHGSERRAKYRHINYYLTRYRYADPAHLVIGSPEPGIVQFIRYAE